MNSWRSVFELSAIGVVVAWAGGAAADSPVVGAPAKAVRAMPSIALADSRGRLGKSAIQGRFTDLEPKLRSCATMAVPVRFTVSFSILRGGEVVGVKVTAKGGAKIRKSTDGRRECVAKAVRNTAFPASTGSSFAELEIAFGLRARARDLFKVESGGVEGGVFGGVDAGGLLGGTLGVGTGVGIVGGFGLRTSKNNRIVRLSTVTRKKRGLSKRQVKSTLKRRFGDLARCFDPGKVAKVSVRFAILPSGRVKSAKVSAGASRGQRTCVVRQVKSTQFHKSKAKTSVRARLELERVAGGLGPSGAGAAGWGTIGTGKYGAVGRGGGSSGSAGGSRRLRGPQIRLGSVRATGTLDKAIIRRYVRRELGGKFRDCYERGLLVNPTLRGTVTAEFVIAPDGTVQSANARGLDAKVAACVEGVVKLIHFPKPKGGSTVKVRYPFQFRPN